MAYVDWMIKGPKIVTCNCDYGCPCEILDGEEQEPTTPFDIHGSTVETEPDPVFADIEFAYDMDARTARVAVPVFAAMELSLIRNPVTAARCRAQIHLPDGWECRSAESASADARGSAGVKFDDTHRYGFSTYVAYGPQGLIEGR